MSEISQALKNLRAFTIVMVVSFHSALAYLASQPVMRQPFDSPPYDWLSTPILDQARWLGFDLYAAFQYVSLMPVMFFLSGVFVWPSLVRKGSLTFLTSRLLRIGLPFLLGVYVLMPLAYYPAYRVTAIDPTWSAYWRQFMALPFRPNGPLWFLWELLLFDIVAAALYRVAPQAGNLLRRFSAGAGDAPGRYFCGLVAVSALVYVPLASVVGPAEWRECGPFALQPDRILLYLVYFFAGVGVGAHGYDRGLLRPDGKLARRWHVWLGAAFGTFLLWMACVAPSVHGRSNALIDLAGYLAVVLAVASACFCFAAVFLRFGSASWSVAGSLAEHAYVIYLVHYVFVVWLQYALLDTALPAVLKASLVFAGALALSWTAAIVIGRALSAVSFARLKAPLPQQHGGTRQF